MAARSPKVTIHEAGAPKAPVAEDSPSAQMIKSAIEPRVLRVNGRAISVRKPSVLAQFAIVEAMGEASGNQQLMGMVMPLIYVGDIDGDVIPLPKNRLQVDGLIARLNDDGLEAVMGWYLEVILGPTLAAIDDAQQRAALKN